MTMQPHNILLYIKRTVLCVLCCGMLCGGYASRGQSTMPVSPQDKQILLKNKTYQQGLNALKKQLPLQASKLFQECLKSKTLTESQQRIITASLAEALIRAHKIEQGLHMWEQLPDSAAKSYWRAVGLLEQGQFLQALQSLAAIGQEDELYHSALQLKSRLGEQLQDVQLVLDSLNRLASAADPAISLRAKLLLVDALLDQHDYQAAASNLVQAQETLVAAPDNVPLNLKAYAELLDGKLAMGQNNLPRACALFEAVMNNNAYPKKIRDLALLALAHAEIVQEKQAPTLTAQETEQKQQEIGQETVSAGEAVAATTADDRLIVFIGKEQDSALVQDAMQILLDEGIFANDPQAMKTLEDWVAAKDALRQPAAMYALGQVQLAAGEWENAYNTVLKAIASYPQSTAVQILCKNTLTALLQADLLSQAAELLEQCGNRDMDLRFQQAILAYKQKNYPLAQELFKQTAQQGNYHTAQHAVFNENLAALHHNDTGTIVNLSVSKDSPREVIEKILFEQAHYAAQRNQPQAAKLLEQFIAVAENEELKTRATLDQVYVALTQTPAALDTASTLLAILDRLPLTAEQQLQVLRYHMTHAELSQTLPQAIRYCRQALELAPQDAQADLLYLKLGELLFKNGNFSDSQLHLQSFPEKYPASPLRAAALFLAGKAAQHSNTATSLNTALEIFQKLEQEESHLQQPAGIERAATLLRMGQTDLCIETLQRLLASSPARYLRLLALSIQADAWSMKEGISPQALTQAVALCSDVLNEPNIGTAWQFKARTQRAQFYERLNDPQKALDDYAAVLMYTPDERSTNQRRDWHWFYNAGFASIRILSGLERWQDALAIAAQLAETAGPRAGEAAALARRIRLEHFVWQDEVPESLNPVAPASQTKPVQHGERAVGNSQEPEHAL